MFRSLRRPVQLLLLSVLVVGIPEAGAQGPGPQAVNGLEITPDGGTPFVVVPGSTGHSLSFWAQNSLTTSASYTFSCTKSGNVVCRSISPTSATIPAGGGREIEVIFDAISAAGLGSITVTASPGGETGRADIVVKGQAAPPVALRNHNGTNRDRSLCLTFGAGEAAGIQCGDLLITHPMPAFRTMNRDRALTLLYNSAQALPMPRVAVTVTQGSYVETPTSMYTHLTVNGAIRDSATYAPWGTPQAPAPRQIVLRYDVTAGTPVDSTGIYPFTVLVRNVYGAVVKEATLSGQLIVVNRSASDFGAGWSLAGFERLYFNQPVGAPNNTLLWVGGDGSAQAYTPSGTAGIWLGAAGEFPDSIKLVAGQYVRPLRYNVQVAFDSLGRHVTTTNRTGQVTTFGYNAAGRLSTITIPPAGQSGTQYTLTYASNKLDMITDPGGRVLNATVNGSGQLTSLADPDNVSTTFAYLSPVSAKLISRRVNRRGLRTDFVYNQSRVQQVLVPVDSPATTWATTTVQAWDVHGATPGPHSTPVTAVDTNTSFTRYDGARTNVADTAQFWVDRWGAPTLIVGSIADTTMLTRGSVAFPALVTRVRFPNGRIVDQSYNTRGNLSKIRNNINPPVGDPRTSVRTYQYPTSGTHRDSPTEIADSVNNGIANSAARRTRYKYNGFGLTDTIYDARGHRTSFQYKTTATYRGLVTRVIEHNVETWAETPGANDTAFVWADIVQRFDYDAKGNLRADTSAVGAATSYVTDPVGRVTNVYDPLRTRTERAYDALNRVTLFRQYTTPLAHPGIPNPLASCESTQVICADSTKAWDGFPANLSTTFAHNNSAVKSVTDPRSVVRSYGYDGRGLINRETDDFGADEHSFYGPSGLLDSVESRTGKTVRQYYDAAGRRRALAFSSVASPVPASSETVPGDSIRYTYDKMGNPLTVISREGTIRREYYTNGLLSRKIMEWQAALGIPPDTMSYLYDETGGIRKINHGADSTRYHYTETTGVLDSMVVWLGAGVNLRKSFLFTWDSLGRRRTVSYPTWPSANNRMTVRFRYDKLGTIRRIVSNHPQGAITDQFTFTYRNLLVDPIGRILKDSLTCAASSTTCGGSNRVFLVSSYNRRSELVRQTRTLGSLVSTDSMRFDNSGNMIFRARGEPADTHVYTLSTGAHNRLAGWTRTALGNTTRAVTYRADGSRLREVRAPWNNQAPEERYYYYDGLGRNSGTGEWISPTLFSDQATACQYDGDGRMVGPCDPFSPKLTFDGDNSSGTAVTTEGHWRFFHGPGLDDPLMGYFRGGVNGPRLFYWVTDGNGREFAVADSTASLGSNDNNGPIGAYRYAGGTKAPNSFGANRFASSSAPKVSFFRNRAYDQESGRWTQEDPIGVAGGLNLYQFNGNNPVSNTDPFGLSPWGLFAKTVKGVYKAVTRSHADKILDKGGTVTVAGKGASSKAGKLAKDQWGDKAVRHEPHAEGQKPHYQHKSGGRGHINFVDKLGTIGVATFGDNIVGNAVDFFNPVGDVKAVLDLVGEVSSDLGK